MVDGETELGTTSNDDGVENRTILLVAGIILAVVSLLVRAYYLNLTTGQAVWWDEANYLVKAKSLALGLPDTGYDAGRPIVPSILMAPFFALGLGELGVRIALNICSLCSIYLLYRLGKQLLNPWVGLIAAALFSTHYLNLFYSERIMCEIPYVTSALLALCFFLSNRPALVWLSGPLFALTVLLRYPAVVIPLAVLAFVFLSEPKTAVRRKEYYIAFVLAALVAASDLAFRGGATLRGGSHLMATETLGVRLGRLAVAFQSFKILLHPILFIVFVLGLCLALWYLFHRKSYPGKFVKSHLLLILLWIGPILIQGLVFNHLENRYLIATIPPALLIIGSFLHWCSQNCPKDFKEVFEPVALLLIIYICWSQAAYSNRLIKERRLTYHELKTAGLWLKTQEGPGRVVSKSVAQLTYYSERPGVSLPNTQAELMEVLKGENNRYLVISAFEPHPDWTKKLNLVGLDLVPRFADPQESPRSLIFGPSPK